MILRAVENMPRSVRAESTSLWTLAGNDVGRVRAEAGGIREVVSRWVSGGELGKPVGVVLRVLLAVFREG